MAIEKKVPAEFTDLMSAALGLHQMTGGAPVEVKDGTRQVKIGPWLSPDIMPHVKEIALVIKDMIIPKKEDKPPAAGN